MSEIEMELKGVQYDRGPTNQSIRMCSRIRMG